LQEGFAHATHQIPMLSLENSYNSQDLLKRDEFIIKHLYKNHEPEASSQKPIAHTYYIEPKFDGISVEVIYKN
jgi:DNA ligase (NAD+)